MTDVSTARSALPPPPLGLIDKRIANAVALHRFYAGIALGWTTAVGTLAPAVVLDEKDRRAQTRTLRLDPRAFMILQLIWLESPFVDESVLAAMGTSRNFCNGVNCRQLALELAEDKASVDATEKAVRGIVKAAVNFGLIQTEKVGTKRNLLKGTERLHAIMLKLTESPFGAPSAPEGGEA